MLLRQKIGMFLIALMLAGQIALAQHATVHAIHNLPAPVEQHDHDDHDHPAKALHDACQICLTAKDFAKVLTLNPPPALIPWGAGQRAFLPAFPLPDGVRISPYAARAPPALLA